MAPRTDSRRRRPGPGAGHGPGRGGPGRALAPGGRRPRLRVPVTAFAALLLAAGRLAAQDPAPGDGAPGLPGGPYVLEPTDTLWFHETTRGSVVLMTPGGDLPVETEQEALIGLTASGPGAATAWYQALHLHTAGPAGERTPPTGDLLGATFELGWDGSGALAVRRLPEIPAAVAAVADLSHQFDDFWVALPEGPPPPGFTWRDTVSHDGAGRPADTYSSDRVLTLRVRGDTTWTTGTATVVEVEQQVRIRSSSPLEGRPATAEVELAGTETGLVVFDWAAGRLLARTREGELSGTFRILEGGVPVELPQHFWYAGLIEAVRP